MGLLRLTQVYLNVKFGQFFSCVQQFFVSCIRSYCLALVTRGIGKTS